MRVCLVSRELAPFFGAGIGVYASGAAAAWRDGGHETHVLTAARSGLDASAFPGVALHAAGERSHATPAPAPGTEYLHHAWAVHSVLRRLHRRHPFDYVEFPDYWAEGYYALRSARTSGDYAGAVLGVRLHTPTRFCRELNDESPDPAAPGLEECEESAMAAADVLLSPTRSLLDRARAALLARELSPPPGEVVRYPFDAAAAVRDLSAPALRPHAAPSPADESPRTSPESRNAPRRVLFLGRLERRKGVELLVSAAAAMLDSGLDAEFLLVGGDTSTGPGGTSMLSRLRALAARHDRIRFEPARPRHALGALIRSSAVCCFPSLWENFPNVCLEAMSLGACVVGSDAGGMGEIIEDGVSGLLFRTGEAADLRRALHGALGDEALRTRLGRAAPARVRELCDPARIIRDTQAAIDRARGLSRPQAFTDSVPFVPPALSVRLAADFKAWLKGTPLHPPLKALRDAVPPRRALPP